MYVNASSSSALTYADSTQARSTDVPTLLNDAKAALQHLAQMPSDPADDLDINPNAIATLAALADQARSELEGKSHTGSCLLRRC
jgi:hypothetical protein